MRSIRAAISGVTGILCAFILASCGGGGYGGGGSMTTPPPTVTLTVAPTTINLGQSATLTWSATSGTTCTASGAWTGTQTTSGTANETPAAAGTATYTLTCTGSGGGYGSGGSSGTASAKLTVNPPSGFSLTNLVADVSGGTALNVDANLVNPWGLSIPAGSFPAWIANNHTETSTLYDGNGKAQPHPAPLIANFAVGAGGVTFDPTGIVFNASTDFVVTSGAKSGPSNFIYVGEGGMVAGWAGAVDPANAITKYTDTGGAVYKGLAIAKNGANNYLYATDFHNNKVDVFAGDFTKQATSATAFTFADATIPAGYAPFGIQAIANGAAGATQIYVSYAQQAAPANHDNNSGAGLGYVDIYDTNGKFIKQLIAKGALDAPWGMALAPADFGTMSNALLVGNFGDGKINAYDAAAGTLIGTLSDASGKAIATPGLWGIAFGNDANNQPHNTLFYAAGTNNEANGSYGRIDLGAAPILNAPPVVTLTVPSGSLKGTVTLSATVTDPISIAQVDFLDGATLIKSVTTAPYTITWDTTTVPDGAHSLKATATDVDANVGSSAVSTVIVGNTAVTLTQLQTQIFTPICSVCHTGVASATSNGLPGIQNLMAGHTFSNIVGVTSLEVPSLMRIKAGDPANSYLVQKILGSAGISGARMPQGCPTTQPCLDAATIGLVQTWVSQGALNN